MEGRGAHRRLNRLTGQWVLVSPYRTARPWLGQVEAVDRAAAPAVDPDCALCPGGERAGGERTPTYRSTYVFDNDFPALLPDDAAVAAAPVGDELLVVQPERGICRVVCYSPRHDLGLGALALDAVHEVVETWSRQYEALGAVEWVRNVQVFENRGAMMGASNPHPHGQIWANETLPNEVVAEQATQAAHVDAGGGCLLCAYVAAELDAGERVVLADDDFLVVVPFWAVWPYEVLVLPRRHRGALPDLSTSERRALADVLGRITRRYDRLFDVPFPYSMGFHQRPTDGEAHPEWHLHAHVYPPLLRSATVRKFMVGYELLGQPQRDLTPEAAARRLAEVGEG